MAFDASSLNLILGSVGGGAIALYEYSTPDMIIDVVGLEYFTAITAHRLRVNDLVLVTAEDETAIVQIISVSEDGNATATFVGKEDAVLSTKSPIIDWEDRIALVLGTSIPHQGGDIDSYHGLMGEALGFSVINNAWAGSRARYDVNGDPFDIGTVKTLSMTEDDRLAGLALYGNSSAYHDDFDIINKASQMTVDYRIKAEFAANDISVVFLDHNHNDRLPPYGTLDPPSSAIGDITKGVTTTITLSTPGIFAVGDAIAIRVTGIAKLDYFAGRVQSVAGNAVTVNVDSSGFAGSFTSGTAYKYDRNTLYGAFEFLISYINWAAVLYGRTVTIILSGAPSAYTNDVFDPKIRSSSEAIRDVADKWGLAYFDVEREMAIDERSHIIYLSDTVHPIERPERQVIANYWARWGSGGAIRRLGDYEFLRAGSDTFIEDREAFYTKFKDGFTTPTIIQAAAVNVFTDNFAAGLGGWTLSGSGILPTTVAAPWNGAETAAYCISNGSDTSYLAKTGLVLDKGVALQFDAYLPAVSGLTALELPATVQIAQIRTPGAYYAVQMIVRQTSVVWKVQYFETPNTTLRSVTCRTIRLAAATKYTVRFEYYRGEAGYPGGVYMTVNGVRVTFPDDIADSGQPIATDLWLGVTSCNTGLPFPLYLGNVSLDKRAVQDFTLRGTGQVIGFNNSLTVVNGIVTAIGADPSVMTATRTALADANTGVSPRYLTEAGREGWFKWSSANLSAAVAVDTQQGVYVPPASAPTGASGAWVRIYSGPLNIQWFGAVAGNVTDCSAAIQCAANVLLLTGGKLYIPRGLYKVTTTVTIDQSALTSSPDEKRISIEGDGSGNTQFRWSGTGPCLRFIAGTSGGIHAFMTMRGFAIDGAAAVGQHGLKIENASWFELSDLKIQECDDGFIAEDCLSFEARSCVFRFNVRGTYVYRVDGSRPNNITFLDCEFGSNSNVGAHVVEAGGVRFIGGATESNGTDAGAAIRCGLKIEDAGTQSGIGLYCEGVHFENNRDKADIWLDQTTAERVLHHISGNAFLRVANSDYVTNPIRVDCNSGTAVQVNVVGNAFKGFNGYVASATRPYVNIANCLGTAWLVRMDGNHFADSVEVPNQSANLRYVVDDVFQNVFRLTAGGSAIGPAIADFFGANSAFPTEASTTYEIIVHLAFTKSTAGTVTFTITNTQTYSSITAEVEHTAAAGMGTQAAPTKGGITNVTTAAAALPASPSLNDAVNHRVSIRAIAECNLAGNIRIQVTSSAGTVTPLRGSFFTVRRIGSSNVGTFAA